MKYVNYASYLPAPQAALEVATAPFPSVDGLADDEIIIKNKAVAINPVDWKIQSFPPGNNRFNIKYPAILGEDVAGEVLYVGSSVSQFKKGDRVLAYALGLGSGDTEKSGFQLYVKLKAIVASKIPDNIDYESAVVLPLSISTAAAGLYLQNTLGLRAPELPSSSSSSSSSPPPASKTQEALLIWGGSSSVGSSVIQLAAAAGYTVVTTASPANYSYCKGLGAQYVLDYHNPDVVAILAAVLARSGAVLVGAYEAIGTATTVRQTAAVVAALGGGRVAAVGGVPEGDLGKDVEVVSISSAQIVASEPGVARRIWGEYVPAALEAGVLKAAPQSTVVGRGLYYLQGALDLNKSGVSAAKVVVSL
ncbi:GroES-like protein [Cryphonectria parasitica EP155]|uniref:GroES-like protein n=1 Tax=Cryphonectria parasitica (strain ATCC 38755 / EP155) TaxID=660469 RepID=A0A9P4XWJ4_CRYP1|nr:GroES-like protein [Cryphonectria parasitica EP155]KAF3762609.1 GroES-like protein [Cryphonectria parasitica EP155]